MKIYIAGPMTGLPDFNRGAFFTVENWFREVRGEKNHVILNPAILPLGLEHGDYMDICIPMVKVATAIVLLPGWEKSRGANLEVAMARFRKLPVFEVFAEELNFTADIDGLIDARRHSVTIAQPLDKGKNKSWVPQRLTFVLEGDNPHHVRVMQELL